MTCFRDPLSSQPPTAIDGSTSVWSYGDRHLIRVGHHPYEDDAWLLVKTNKGVSSNALAHAIMWSTDLALKPELWHVHEASNDRRGRHLELVSGDRLGRGDKNRLSLTFWDAIEACRNRPPRAWQPCLSCSSGMSELWGEEVQLMPNDLDRCLLACACDGMVAFKIIPAEDVETVAQDIANGGDPCPAPEVAGVRPDELMPLSEVFAKLRTQPASR